MNKTAIIAGATGLVGSHLLKLLELDSNIEQLYILSRRAIDATGKGQVIVNEDLSIPNHDKSQISADLGFICLGSTLKQAGSKQALRKIDCDLVIRVANTMQAVGVKKLIVVSSLGASQRSLAHYLQVKGDMEYGLSQLHFESLIFVRPGPLAGRTYNIRSDEVMVQRLLRFFNPLLLGPLANFKPIAAQDVAQAMLSLAHHHHELSNPTSINSAQLSQICRRENLSK